LVGAIAATPPADAQGRDWSKVEIKTTKLAEGIYEIEGAGGNMGLCTGPDGAFLIDDQFAALTPRIKEAIAKVSDRPVRFVLNTHCHGDHVGGNETFGTDGAVSVGQENARQRLSAVQFRQAMKDTLQPLAHAGLPAVTFQSDLTFHLNGETIHAYH